MLSQLAKLASRLDSVGLTKEADVLDAFIKHAADGDYSEVSGEYHQTEEEEELFGKWHDESEIPNGEETEHLASGDGSDLYHPEREDDRRFRGTTGLETAGERRDILERINEIAVTDLNPDLLDDEEIAGLMVEIQELMNSRWKQ